MISRIIPEPPKGWKSWEALMLLALAQAELAKSQNEVPVGAIIVTQEGMIIGQGHNCTEREHDPTGHAEIIALRKASAFIDNHRHNGAVMLVTLEPCFMCTGALVQARLSGVIYGAYDKKAGAVSSCLEGFDLPFHNSKVWHMGGILEEQCLSLLQEFFSLRRSIE